jgi:hypothetical protein
VPPKSSNSSLFSACGSLFHPSCWEDAQKQAAAAEAEHLSRQPIGTTEVVPFPNAGEIENFRSRNPKS